MINYIMLNEIKQKNSNGIIPGDGITALIKSFMLLCNEPGVTISDELQTIFINKIINYSNARSEKVYESTLVALQNVYEKLNSTILTENQKRIQINEILKNYNISYTYFDDKEELLNQILNASSNIILTPFAEILFIKEIINIYNSNPETIYEYIVDNGILFKDNWDTSVIYNNLPDSVETIEDLYQVIDFIILYFKPENNRYTTEITDIRQSSECDYDTLTIEVRQSWLNVNGKIETRKKNFNINSSLFYDQKENIYRSELIGDVVSIK